MGSLENIPKKDFFRIPENYFDSLPMKIGRRIETKKHRREFQPAFRYASYALPVLLFVIILIYDYTRKANPESMLSSVETAALIQYLEEWDVTTEELLNNADFSSQEVEAFEMAVFDLNFQDEGGETPDL